ncbi:hypothetical protein [Kineosporia babensis]|uniref:FlgD Ig-like domain-containing protein n=1 Tax=Kineosporia babensis TaxID=499548 RepID=A0A9X1NHP9_9ACTN|nr:hypothetical protein [Kineosporia babensis]MCD5315217.1 hypothetical protein [Kineosporia babensis]
MSTAPPHTRRRKRQAAGGFAALITIFALASPAGATGSPGAELPGQISKPQQLTLLGAGPSGYTVARNHTEVLTAPAGKPFADNRITYSEDGSPGRLQQVKDLTGHQLRWATAADSAWRIHTADLRTGATTTQNVPDRPLAFVPTGYVGELGSRITLHRKGLADKVLINDVSADPGMAGAPTYVAADAGSALISYARTIADQPTSGRTLVHVPFGSSAVEVIVPPRTAPGYWPGQVALTPSSFVWLSYGFADRSFSRIGRRARTDTEITDQEVPWLRAGTRIDFAATDQQVAVADSWVPPGKLNTTGLRVLVAGAWREVPLPESLFGTGSTETSQFGGVEAIGNRLVYALGSAAEQPAGVHEITADGTSRPLAALTETYRPVETLALAAGRLYYTGRPGSADPDDGIRLIARRPVEQDSAGRLSLGAKETGEPFFRVPAWLMSPPGALAASGDRWLLRGLPPTPHYYLASSTFSTTDLGPASAEPTPLRLSGPYAVAGNRVFRDKSATPLLDLTSGTKDVDLFGSRVLWSTTGGQLRTQDVTQGAASTLAQGAGGEVAIWGSDIAWADGSSLRIATLAKPQQPRVVTNTGGVHELRFTEGTLSWQDNAGRLRVLNTRSNRTNPQITPLKAPADVYDHLMTGVAANGRAQVLPLPFGQDTNYRPRLIAAKTEPSVTAGTNWAPEFDTSKALIAVKLTIRRNSRVVANLTGEAAHGTVHGLNWDTTGATPGVYTWALTAQAADGDGTLAGPVEGKVTVART